MNRGKHTASRSGKASPPAYRLETDEECAALKRLKLPPWGNQVLRRKFQQAVLAYLASIDALRKNEQPPKNAKVAQSFKRRAKMVRNFVDRMKKPKSETWAGAVAQRSPWPPPFAWSRFPERELLSYAEACERGEAFFSGQSHHARDPQSPFIVKLLNFVRLHTGESHLKELATLLKRPCDDVGMNVSRLDQLLRDHKARYPEVHREAEQAKAGIGALLVEQILNEPPDS